MSSEEDECTEVLPTFEQVMSWKKREMEAWLMERSLPKSSKKKDILANRILRYMRGDDDDDFDDIDSDNDDVPAVCHMVIPVCPGKYTDFHGHGTVMLAFHSDKPSSTYSVSLM